MIGALARSNPGPNLDANQVVLAQRAASTSSSVGLGLFDGKPTRTAGAPAPRSGSGAAGRNVSGISERQSETPATWTCLMPN